MGTDTQGTAKMSIKQWQPLLQIVLKSAKQATYLYNTGHSNVNIDNKRRKKGFILFCF